MRVAWFDHARIPIARPEGPLSPSGEMEDGLP
jgi:hypothetical protein